MEKTKIPWVEKLNKYSSTKIIISKIGRKVLISGSNIENNEIKNKINTIKSNLINNINCHHKTNNDNNDNNNNDNNDNDNNNNDNNDNNNNKIDFNDNKNFTCYDENNNEIENNIYLKNNNNNTIIKDKNVLEKKIIFIKPFIIHSDEINYFFENQSIILNHLKVEAGLQIEILRGRGFWTNLSHYLFSNIEIVTCNSNRNTTQKHKISENRNIDINVCHSKDIRYENNIISENN